jgi:hypothetical protein
MEQFIGCDADKKFSLFNAMNQEGQYGKPVRVAHDREQMRAFLEALPAASKIALETSGVIIGWWRRWSGPATSLGWRMR